MVVFQRVLRFYDNFMLLSALTAGTLFVLFSRFDYFKCTPGHFSCFQDKLFSIKSPIRTFGNPTALESEIYEADEVGVFGK